MSRILCLVVMATLVASPIDATARITQQWSYDGMFKEADLVAIAAVVSSKDIGARTTLPEYVPAVAVLPVVTELEVRVLFKGRGETKKFLLSHYRYESEHDEFATTNTPDLIRIQPDTYPTFLVFLKEHQDGTFIPVTGQIDPAALSVLDLRGGAN